MANALPHRHQVTIPDAKLGYLLNSRSKGYLYREVMGFSEANIDDLRSGLLLIAQTQPVVKIIESEHGTKYNIIGHLNTPKRGLFEVVTAWIVRTGETVPRFVTAPPTRKG